MQAWAERQAERYQWLVESTAGAPEQWAAHKAELEATGQSFVWTYHKGEMWEFPTSSIPHRVIKKTATRVYVDRESFVPARQGVTWQERAARYPVRTFVLDRATLEREGEAYRPGRSWRELFYTVPFEETPAWREELASLRHSFQAMLTPESWLAHRRHVDEYLATGGVIRGVIR